MLPIPNHPMYSVTDTGKVYSHYRNKFIKPTTRKYNKSGYQHLGLLVSSNPKKYKYYYVHQLVMLAYIGPYPIGMEIDHIDGNTGNNNLTNLRYVTHIENCKTRNTYRGGPKKRKEKTND